jgi:hypothetical protein
MIRLFASAAAFLLAATLNSSAQNLVWKTEVELGEPEELPHCDIKTDYPCHDYVPYRQTSKYGQNYYLTYFEGVRAGIGFGTVDNQVNQWSIAALHPGAFDWGGYEENGAFRPKYVIKRFYFFNWDGQRDPWETKRDPSAKSYLQIFRLLADGTSCMFDSNRSWTAVNSVAREWAQRDSQNPKCLYTED